MLLCCKNSREEWVTVCLRLLRTCWKGTSDVQQSDGGWRMVFFGERQKLLAALQAGCFVCTHHHEFWFRLGIKVKYGCGSSVFFFQLQPQFSIAFVNAHLVRLRHDMMSGINLRGHFLPKSGRDLMELLGLIVWLEQSTLGENRGSGRAVQCSRDRLTCAGGWQRTTVLQGQSKSLSLPWQAKIRRREESRFAIQIYDFYYFFLFRFSCSFSHTDFPILFPLTKSAVAGFSIRVRAAARRCFRRWLDSVRWGSCRCALLLLVRSEPLPCSLGALTPGGMNFILMPESLLVPEDLPDTVLALEL